MDATLAGFLLEGLLTLAFAWLAKRNTGVANLKIRVKSSSSHCYTTLPMTPLVDSV
jgi:hypothetical protein